jgi:hypothetical protein
MAHSCQSPSRGECSVFCRSIHFYTLNAYVQVQQRLASRRVGTFHRAASAVFDMLAIKDSEQRRSPDGRLRHLDTEEDSGDEDNRLPAGNVSPTASYDNSFGEGSKRRFSKNRSASFNDDDDATAYSRSSQRSRRSSSIKDVEGSLSRSNSIQAHVPQDGALPEVMGKSGPNVGTAADIIRSMSNDPSSRPGSREKTPTGRSSQRNIMSPSGRSSLISPATTGRGSHLQYKQTHVVVPTANKEQLSVNFAEELSKWLNDVTSFTGNLFNKSASQNPRALLKKTSTEPSLPNSASQGLAKANSFGGISSNGGSVGSVTSNVGSPARPLRPYLEVSDDDDEVSVNSQITTGSVVISTLPIKSKPYGGRSRETQGAFTASRGPSSLELLMLESGINGPIDMELGKLSNCWNPKRTHVKLRKVNEPTPKLKVAKTVSEERKKYRVKGYLPDIKRGKNPLHQPGRRAQESVVFDIVEALAEHSAMLNSDGNTDAASLAKYVLDSSGAVRRRDSVMNHEAAKKLAKASAHAAAGPSSSSLQEEKGGSLFFLTGFTESSGGDTYRVPSTLFMSQTMTEIPSNKANQIKTLKDKEITDRFTVTPSSVPSYYISSLRGKSRLASESLTVATSPSRQKLSVVKSQASSSFGINTPGPWIPPGGLNVMVSDKTDIFFGHEENRDVGMTVDNTKNKTVIGRQKFVREAFEKYCKDEAKNSGLELLASMKKNRRKKGTGSRGASPNSSICDDSLINSPGNSQMGSPGNSVHY